METSKTLSPNKKAHLDNIRQKRLFVEKSDLKSSFDSYAIKTLNHDKG